MVNCAPVVRFVNINSQKTSSSTKETGYIKVRNERLLAKGDCFFCLSVFEERQGKSLRRGRGGQCESHDPSLALTVSILSVDSFPAVFCHSPFFDACLSVTNAVGVGLGIGGNEGWVRMLY